MGPLIHEYVANNVIGTLIRRDLILEQQWFPENGDEITFETFLRFSSESRRADPKTPRTPAGCFPEDCPLRHCGRR
jgi:hypothetical protein